MSYTNNDGANESIPDGASALAASIDTYIQDVKKAYNERLATAFGGDWSTSTEADIEKIDGVVDFNGTGKQANQPVANLGSISGTVNLDFDVRGNYIKATLTGATTFTVSNTRVGTTYILMLIQDATGGRVITWPSGIRWAGGTTPTLNTAANRVTLVTLVPFSSTVALGALAGTNFNVS